MMLKRGYVMSVVCVDAMDVLIHELIYLCIFIKKLIIISKL